MELLSIPEITEDEEAKVRKFIAACSILNIDDDIMERTVNIRKLYKVKLPDSIIAATALVFEVSLITADIGILKVDELIVEKLIL